MVILTRDDQHRVFRNLRSSRTRLENGRTWCFLWRLATSRSLVTPIKTISPSLKASESKCRWPACKMSKVPPRATRLYFRADRGKTYSHFCILRINLGLAWSIPSVFRRQIAKAIALHVQASSGVEDQAVLRRALTGTLILKFAIGPITN